MTKTAKECLEPIVNAAYRAGQNNDHPNNANLHKVVDQALKELEAIISQQVIGHTQYPDQSKDVTYDMYIESTLQAKQRQALQTALYGKDEK